VDYFGSLQVLHNYVHHYHIQILSVLLKWLFGVVFYNKLIKLMMKLFVIYVNHENIRASRIFSYPVVRFDRYFE